MYIFHQIIDHYFRKLDKGSEIHFYKIFFDIFQQKKYSIKEKYVVLEKCMENDFLNEERKNQFLCVFQEIQHIYFSIERFAYIVKYQRAKIIVDNDLEMNVISEKNKYVIGMYQEGGKYLFHIRDVIHLVNHAIGHSNRFFSEPLVIKNPYNNIPFTKSSLYNFYFYMRFCTCYFSELFHSFFQCNFNLSEFSNKNMYSLRNYAIHDYLKNNTTDMLRTYVFHMIEEYNFLHPDHKIDVHDDFPMKKYVTIMKPYLKLYLISHYSLLYVDKVRAKKHLYQKLLEFHLFNRDFGKKRVRIHYTTRFNKKETPIGNTIYFIDKHKPFCETMNQSDTFLYSHLLNVEEGEDD